MMRYQTGTPNTNGKVKIESDDDENSLLLNSSSKIKDEFDDPMEYETIEDPDENTEEGAGEDEELDDDDDIEEGDDDGKDDEADEEDSQISQNEDQMTEDDEDCGPADLVQYLKAGHFPWQLPANEPSPSVCKDWVDVAENGGANRIEAVVGSYIDDDQFSTDEEKTVLKRAALAVIIEQKDRKAVIEEMKIDWFTLVPILSGIYKSLGLTWNGAKHSAIPDVDLHLLEMRLDEEDQDIDSKPFRRTKKEMEAIRASGEAERKKKIIIKKAMNIFGGLTPSSAERGNSSPYNRKLGECVPSYWKEPKYLNLMTYLIRKSVDLTLQSKVFKSNAPEAEIRYKAVESVLLNNEAAKAAAEKYNIHYSTLHNITHRALCTISTVLGRESVPEQTLDLLRQGKSFDEIASAMNVRRAATLARFIPIAARDIKDEAVEEGCSPSKFKRSQ